MLSRFLLLRPAQLRSSLRPATRAVVSSLQPVHVGRNSKAWHITFSSPRQFTMGAYYSKSASAVSAAPPNAKDLSSTSSAVVSRLMMPDDANPAGNVHGGTTMKMIEQAGWLAATRHCNAGVEGGRQITCPTVRIEKMDFQKPIFIGDVATLYAQVVFTSDKSLAVHVKVYAEKPLAARTDFCNQALVWYVATQVAGVSGNPPKGPMSLERVPPFAPNTPEEEALFEEARMMYRARKEMDEQAASPVPVGAPPAAKVGDKRVRDSECELNQLLMPSDCTPQSKIITGGTLLKLMDSAAGVVAYRHCGSNVVTAGIDSIDLHNSIRLGDIVHISGKATFASARSLEIEVTATAESAESHGEVVAAVGQFTFVSLDKYGRTQPVPGLAAEAEGGEAVAYAKAKRRYERRKKARIEAAAKAKEAALATAAR